MELRHLRYFVAVALEENITRAAERLRVSQPALSRQIRDLEDELGFELLERTAKSIALTEAGRTFLEEASAVLERLEQGIESARAIARDGCREIHVGYAPTLTVKILPPTIRAFQTQHPKAKVKLHDLSSEEMLDGLRSGKLDFVLVGKGSMDRANGVRFVDLKEERVKLAVPLGHELSMKPAAPIKALSKTPLHGFRLSEYPEYGDLMKSVFAGQKSRPKLAEEHESSASLIAAVESGMGVAIVTESLACVASGRIQLLDMDPQPQSLVIGIAWSKDRLSPLEASFLEKAKESCEA